MSISEFPPKVKADWEELTLEVIEQGEGFWKIKNELEYGYELTGYGCENSIIILMVGRQDFKVHITLCHSQVDSDTKVYSDLVEVSDLNEAINNALKKI